MPAAHRWLALCYTVPAEPSRSRVYVWRHLRALCAQTVSSGFAVLPDTPENLSAFETLAADVRRLKGEAFLLRFDYVDEKDDRAVRERFARAAAEEQAELLRRCAALVGRLESGETDRAAVRELKSSLDRFEKSPLRTFSPRGSGEELARAVGEIFGTLRSLPSELSALLRRTTK